MVKRKAKETGASIPDNEPRRSSRRKSAKEEVVEEKPVAARPAKKTKTVPEAKAEDKVGLDGQRQTDSENPEAADKSSNSVLLTESTETETKPVSTGRQYWLMKAEPESRMEKGHDIKFSIDDLAAKKEPEPWDGIRAYPARNNLRAMKKGDLAFFYHSSCKVPAIVGTMEIVKEHSPDLSAHDAKAPYYDPKSNPEDPKWSVVHVEFRQKLKTPVTLKELKEWQTTKGHVLENMQMLKLARLSVSKVNEKEWKYLIGVMKENGDVIKE